MKNDPYPEGSNPVDPDKSIDDYVKVYGEQLTYFDWNENPVNGYFKGGMLIAGDGYWSILNYNMEEVIYHEDVLGYPTLADANDEYLVVLSRDEIYIYLTGLLHQVNHVKTEPTVVVNLAGIVYYDDYDQQLVVCKDFFYIKHNTAGSALILKFQFSGQLIEVYYHPDEDFSLTNYQDQCLLYMVRRIVSSNGNDSHLWAEYKFVENNDGRCFDFVCGMIEFTEREPIYPYKCYQKYDEEDGLSAGQILVKLPANGSGQLYPAIHISLNSSIMYATDSEIYTEEIKDDIRVIRKFSLKLDKKV